jgi:hypothetical protein
VKAMQRSESAIIVVPQNSKNNNSLEIQFLKEANSVARARIVPVQRNIFAERIYQEIFSRTTWTDHGPTTEPFHCRKLSLGNDITPIDFQHFKTLIKGLSHVAYEFDRGERGGGGRSLFKEIEIDDNGIIHAVVNERLKEFYKELDSFFTYRKLSDFKRLRSLYSQRLFRYLNTWKNIESRKIKINIEELYYRLSVPVYLQKNFGQFRLRALDVATEEINNYTSLHFDWEPIRKSGRGRGGKGKVSDICFNFIANFQDETKPILLDAEITDINEDTVVKDQMIFLESPYDAKDPENMRFKKIGAQWDGTRWTIDAATVLKVPEQYLPYLSKKDKFDLGLEKPEAKGEYAYKNRRRFEELSPEEQEVQRQVMLEGLNKVRAVIQQKDVEMSDVGSGR